MDNIIEFDKSEGVRYFKGSGRLLRRLWLNVHFGNRETIERANSSSEYEITFDNNNRFHSFDDKPAYVISSMGKAYVQHWLKHGQIHREGGPATIRPTYNNKGTEYAWYWEGIFCGSSNNPDLTPTKYNELSTKALTESVRYKEDNKWEREIVPGHSVYYKSPEGSYHRTDGGPAIIKPDYMSWRKGGTFYREDDKPVVIDRENGQHRLCWMTPRGVLHRIYGPAYIVDGRNDWYVDSDVTGLGHSTAVNADTLSSTQLLRHVSKCVTYFEDEERIKTMGEFEGYTFPEQKRKGLEVAKRLYDLKYVEDNDYEEFKDLWISKIDASVSEISDLLRKLNS